MASEFYEVEFRRADDASETAWRALPLVLAHISPSVEIPRELLEAGTTYEVRVRFVDLDGDRSPWATSRVEFGGRLREPPIPDDLQIPDGDCLTWRCPVDGRRVAGFRIRWALGDYRHAPDMTPAHEGLWPSPPFPLCLVPGGPITLAVSAVNADGVESPDAAYLSAEVAPADDALAVTHWQLDVGAAGFPGTIVQGAVAGGEVRGDVDADEYFGPELLALFGDFEDETGFGDESDDGLFGPDVTLAARPFGGDSPDEEFGPATLYHDVLYETPVVVPPAVAAAGRVVSIDLATDGRNARLEYRTNTEPFGPDVSEYGFGAELDDETEEPFGPGAGSAWRPWPGRIPATGGAIELRVLAPGGATRPKVRDLVVTVSGAA